MEILCREGNGKEIIVSRYHSINRTWQMKMTMLFSGYFHHFLPCSFVPYLKHWLRRVPGPLPVSLSAPQWEGLRRPWRWGRWCWRSSWHRRGSSRSLFANSLGEKRYAAADGRRYQQQRGSGGAAVADDALSQNSSKVGEGKFFLNKNSTQEIHMFSNISSLISSFSINVLEVIFHRVFTFDGTILPLALALEDVSPFQIPVRPFKLSFREVWCLSHATLSKSKPHVDFYVSSFLH